MSEVSKIDDLIVVVMCEECLSNTEWKDCDIHPEVECFQVVCENCGWISRDCDTTEHCEIIK